MPRTVDVEARRAQVIDAVWQVAARAGLEAVSARSVAAAAGLSLGAVTRLYPQQEALHVEAMRALGARVGRRVAALEPTGDPRLDAERVLAEAMPLTPESLAEAVVYYDYLARARSVPALREVADEVDDALLALSVRCLAALAPELDEVARTVLALELHALTEGLAFGLVTWPDRRRAEDARVILRGWLRGVSPPG